MEMIERSETANVLDAEANQHMEETRIRKCIVIHDASIELEGLSTENDTTTEKDDKDENLVLTDEEIDKLLEEARRKVAELDLPDEN